MGLLLSGFPDMGVFGELLYTYWLACPVRTLALVRLSSREDSRGSSFCRFVTAALSLCSIFTLLLLSHRICLWERKRVVGAGKRKRERQKEG